MRFPGGLLVLSIVLVSVLPSPLPAAAQSAPAAETASQFYLRWRSTALKAKSVDELMPFWSAEMLDQFNMEDAPARAGMLPTIQHFYGMQTDVTVVKETPTATGATLSLEALDANKKPIAGSVQVVKENGAWKVDNAVERWKPKGQ